MLERVSRGIGREGCLVRPLRQMLLGLFALVPEGARALSCDVGAGDGAGELGGSSLSDDSDDSDESGGGESNDG